MKGFSLQIGDQVVYAASENGTVGVLISNKEGELSINLNGMDSEGIYYSWYNKKIGVGDCFTITYNYIDEAVISKPIFVRDVADAESENKLLLTAYHELRQELLDKGILK